jgi:hypothetical protein
VRNTGDSMTEPLIASRSRGRRPQSFFTRHELNRLLQLYSSRVVSGEWRDYAIDHNAGGAVFSVFRHSFDRPLFAITKRPAGGGEQREFLLHSGPRKLKQSRSIDELLSAFERKLNLIG